MKRIKSTHSKTGKRKRQIIEAALKCFTQTGLTDTSIADISAQAQASVGSIYHHFKSKEQLAAAVYLEGIKDYQDGYIKILESATQAREGIFKVIGYHLHWVVDHPDWSRYLFRQRHANFMGETKQQFTQLNQEFFKNASGWFKKHIQNQTLKNLPPDLFISILMGPCQAFSKQYLLNQTCSDIERASTEIALAVWNALKNDT